MNRLGLSPLGKRGAFWAAASVLALALWSSGAPSTLYPIYARTWDLSPIVITSIFATYQLSLIAVLPIFGNLSDHFGRRAVMIGGTILIALSSLLFALAPNVGFIFAGRILQGAGAGLAMGAATASLLENNPRNNPRFASVVATVSTATGLSLALFVSGMLAQFLPLPLLWSYVVLLLLTGCSLVALLLTPTDKPSNASRWSPKMPYVPSGIRRSFWVAVFSVTIAYGAGAIFLSLGAHMITQFANTTNSAVTGALLATSAVTIGLTALLLVKVPARAQIWAGAAMMLPSLALMVAASARGSLPLFLAWCLTGGVAYSLSFTGGLGLINSIAPSEHRGSILSLLYVITYLFQAVIAIGIGAVATGATLNDAVITASWLLLGLGAVLCILLSIRQPHGYSSSKDRRTKS